MQYTKKPRAKSPVSLLLPVIAGVLLAACSGTTVDSTTTTSPDATSGPTATTTATTLPPAIAPVDGVPEELAALIGAPMPEFDRTIATGADGSAAPEDVQRWLNEWDMWQRWTQANLSTITEEVISIGFEPQGEMYEIWTAGASEDPPPAILAESLGLAYSSDDSDVGTGYGEGRSLTVFSASALFHSYIIIDGVVADEAGPRTESDVAFILVGTGESDGSAIWRLSSVEY